MMSMIAGEGTNSDGREVTMTAQEREKTDAEMTGMTGKKNRRGKAQRTSSFRPHTSISSLINLQNAINSGSLLYSH